MSDQLEMEVAVVGGGAAGLMAALWAARSGARTVLLEGSRACGLKIVISGGGRCNILPSEVDLTDYFTGGSRNVLKRIFRTWSRSAVEKFFVEEVRLPIVLEEDTGKLFPQSQSAKDVRSRLVAAAQDAGAEILTEWRVNSVEKHVSGFRLKSNDGREVLAERIVLATGGLSMPKTGSDGVGYRFATQLGHTIDQTYPALVPLTSEHAPLTELAGISLPVRWRAIADGKVKEERVRELLFTHKGFSGPAVLDASHWSVRDDASIEVSWQHDLQKDDWLALWQAQPKSEVLSTIQAYLPKRMALLFCEEAGVDPRARLGNLPKSDRMRLSAALCAYTLPVSGNTGYRVAEVTGGGIPLSEVEPSTLASRCTENLYLCGEIFDVIGRIGGFNFLWAWVTGRLAGESAARSLSRNRS